MNQLLLISHGGFASGARQATELILGPQPNLHLLELDGQKGIDIFKKELTEKISALTLNQHKLIIISDLKNGSPYNTAMELIALNNLWNNVTLLSGMNLNLILEIVMAIDAPLTQETIGEIITTACEGIYHLQPLALTTNTSDGDE